MQLTVIAKKLNKRSHVPASFSDNNIIGTVLQGFRFEGEETPNTINPSLGKWYMDRDGSCYWGGALVVDQRPVPVQPGSLTGIRPTGINGDLTHLPENYILGMDISHHNGSINWDAAVNGGIRWCYIKISEGVGTPDAMAGKHAIAAREHGLKIGYYHFCRPDTRNGGTVASDAAAEAAEAMRIIAGLPFPDLPLVLDLEDQQAWDSILTPGGYLSWIKNFAEQVKKQAALPIMLYSRKNYLDQKLPADHPLGAYPLWIADYSQTNCQALKCPLGWKDWAMWQYTEQAMLTGNGTLDLSIVKDSLLINPAV